MGKNKIYLLFTLIIVILFLITTSSCVKSIKQTDKGIIEEVEKIDIEVLEEKKEELPAVETEEEITEVETEEVYEYNYVSKSGKIYSDEI